MTFFFKKNLFIIRLSWLALHNPQMDWHMGNFHFELLKHEITKCEDFITSMFGGVHDHACHTPEKKHENECIQNQQKKDIGGTQNPSVGNHCL